MALDNMLFELGISFNDHLDNDLAIFQQQPAGFSPSLGLIVLHRQAFLD
jgi:hypothetical protein